MGLDLTLMPFFGDGKSANFSHSLIPCDRNRDKFQAIMKLPAMDVDDGFISYASRDDKYEEPHYGETIETPYGERLQWTQAKHLKPLITEGAVGAYVQALDDGHRVALYWH